jgi:hypothetical protein
MLEGKSNKALRISVLWISILFYLLIHELLLILLGFQFFFLDFISRYITAIVIFVALFYLNRKSKTNLDIDYPWQLDPVKRFAMQSFKQAGINNLQIHLGLLILLYFRYAILHENLFLSYRLHFYQFAVVALVMELNILYDFGQYLINQWHSSRLQQETFEKEKAQFNLELLRNQINPHFLFNNLNTLSSLIYENQDRAADFLRMLSRVYRNILEFRNRELISIEEELNFFENYSLLLKIRFEGMLFFEINIDESLKKENIIPLTFQMLVENAIKHNIISRSNNLYIKIYNEGNSLIIENNLQLKENLEYSSKLGLQMIQSRFESLSNEKVIIEETKEIFRVKVPVIYSK